jgi:RsiW-degrading membrane proteinase PrsW (M82 family)
MRIAAMLLLILLSGAVAPLAACEFVAWFLRMKRRWRVYRVPFGIGMIVAVVLVAAELRLSLTMEQIVDTPRHALELAFLLGALPEEVLKLVGFLVWIKAGGGGDPRARLVGAVAVAMGFDIIETWLQLYPWSGQLGLWLAMLAQRVVLAAPMSAVGGFVVGAWSAATQETRGFVFARNLAFGCVAAIVAHGVWDGSVFVAVGQLRAQDVSGALTVLVPGLIAALLIGAAAIAGGVRVGGGLRRLRDDRRGGDADDRS